MIPNTDGIIEHYKLWMFDGCYIGNFILDDEEKNLNALQ